LETLHGTVSKPLRDDYFSKYDEVFRQRMPDNKDEKQDELLEDEEISKGWEEYQHEMEIRAEYYSNSPDYELQSPTVGGRNPLPRTTCLRYSSSGSSSSHVTKVTSVKFCRE